VIPESMPSGGSEMDGYRFPDRIMPEQKSKTGV